MQTIQQIGLELDTMIAFGDILMGIKCVRILKNSEF
jgi:hypothetical protein